MAAKKRVQASTPQQQEEDPYDFPPDFEQALVVFACRDAKFMARTAHEVQADLLSSPECKLAMAEAQAIFRETGAPTTHQAAVIARCARRRDEGKVTHETVKAVAGMFDILDDENPPRLEAIEAEAVSVLRSRLRRRIAKAAIAEHTREEWTQMRLLLAREEKLGLETNAGVGLTLTPAVVSNTLGELRKLKRERMGIDVLDDALGGGVPRGTLTAFMGPPGGGKSMALSHVAARRSMMGALVAYATLEVPAPYVTARIVANQTGLTINELIDGTAEVEMRLRLAAWKPVPPFVQDFTPHLSTVDSLRAWVAEIEIIAGRPVDTLVVDYADKLSSGGKVDQKGQYEEMRIVWEGLRVFVHEKQMLGFTASQSKARNQKGKKGADDFDEVADSMHKVRVVDQFIPLAYDDETGEMEFRTAKSRFSEGRARVGPVPANFALGQVSPVPRPSILLVPGAAAATAAPVMARALVSETRDEVVEMAAAARALGGRLDVEKAVQDRFVEKLLDRTREPGDDDAEPEDGPDDDDGGNTEMPF